MKFLSRRGFIVGTILLLSISEIHGAHVRRRRQASGGESELNFESVLDDIGKIPLIGSSLQKELAALADTVEKLNKLTNGALSRIAGGYPPCTIDLDGIECNGSPKNGGIVGITTELINSTMLPSLAKTMILDLLDAGVFPLFDVIFGVPDRS